MTPSILFWFYKEYETCKDRLEQLRSLNTDIKIFALFGGDIDDSKNAEVAVGDLVDDFYCFPCEKEPRWKWQHGDQLIFDWFEQRGKNLEWDSVFIVQWDMLVLEPVSKIFAELEPNQVVLSGMRPFQEVESWWPWALPPRNTDLEDFQRYLGDTLNYYGPLYACLFIIVCLPKSFMAQYAKIGNPELGFLEYKMPTMAKLLNFSVFESSQIEPWWAKDPSTWNLPANKKVLNAVASQISTRLVRDELDNPNGRRLFHPYFEPFYNKKYRLKFKIRSLLAKLVKRLPI